jgi:hypothetical protein
MFETTNQTKSGGIHSITEPGMFWMDLNGFHVNTCHVGWLNLLRRRLHPGKLVLCI